MSNKRLIGYYDNTGNASIATSGVGVFTLQDVVEQTATKKWPQQYFGFVLTNSGSNLVSYFRSSRASDTSFTMAVGYTLVSPANPYDADFSPDGNLLAMVSPTAPGLFLYQRSGTNFTLISGTPALPAGHSAQSVRFSADGTKLMTGGGAAYPFLNLFAVNGTTLTSIGTPPVSTGTTGHGDYAVPVAWHPQGTMFAAAVSGSTAVQYWSVTGTTFVSITPPNSTQPGPISFSPDGTYVACASSNASNMNLYSISGTTFTGVAHGSDPGGNLADVAWSPDSTILVAANTYTGAGIVYWTRSGTTWTYQGMPGGYTTGASGSGCRFSSDGKYLITTNSNGFMQMFLVSGTSMSRIADSTFPSTNVGAARIAVFPSATSRY